MIGTLRNMSDKLRQILLAHRHSQKGPHAAGTRGRRCQIVAKDLACLWELKFRNIITRVVTTRYFCLWRNTPHRGKAASSLHAEDHQWPLLEGDSLHDSSIVTQACDDWCEEAVFDVGSMLPRRPERTRHQLVNRGMMLPPRGQSVKT